MRYVAAAVIAVVVAACGDAEERGSDAAAASDAGSSTADASRRSDSGSDVPVDAGADASTATKDACLPDGAIIEVTALGDTSYFIGGSADPTLTLCRGGTYTFRVEALHHPFWVKTTRTAGKVDAYGTGVTNNGTDAGDVVFAVPSDAPSLLHYVCSAHAAMVGDLVVVGP